MRQDMDVTRDYEGLSKKSQAEVRELLMDAIYEVEKQLDGKRLGDRIKSFIEFYNLDLSVMQVLTDVFTAARYNTNLFKNNILYGTAQVTDRNGNPSTERFAIDEYGTYHVITQGKVAKEEMVVNPFGVGKYTDVKSTYIRLLNLMKCVYPHDGAFGGSIQRIFQEVKRRHHGVGSIDQLYACMAASILYNATEVQNKNKDNFLDGVFNSCDKAINGDDNIRETLFDFSTSYGLKALRNCPPINGLVPAFIMFKVKADGHDRPKTAAAAKKTDGIELDPETAAKLNQSKVVERERSVRRLRQNSTASAYFQWWKLFGDTYKEDPDKEDDKKEDDTKKTDDSAKKKKGGKKKKDAETTTPDTSLMGESKQRKMIVITESMARQLQEEMSFTPFKFAGHIREFLVKLLSDPSTARPSDSLVANGLDKVSLIRLLDTNGIIQKMMKISDRDDDNQPKTATMKIRYSVPKKDFDKKLYKLFDTVFEGRQLQETTGCCGGGAVGASNSGEFVGRSPFRNLDNDESMIRRNSAYSVETTDDLKKKKKKRANV